MHQLKELQYTDIRFDIRSDEIGGDCYGRHQKFTELEL